MRTGRNSILAGLLVVCGVAAVSTGCSSDPRRQAVLTDPTPAMETLDQRTEDGINSWVITRDSNYRMVGKDMARVFYYNRPSRLTREPVPHP